MSIYMMVAGLLAGLSATLIMDVWGVVAGKIGLFSKPSTALLGRWVSCFSEGKFLHEDIRKAPHRPYEHWIGIAAHYAIGVSLGIFFVLLVGWGGLSPKNFLVTAIYGLLTCVFAWFVMFPAFGFGICAVKGPTEAKLFRSSTLNHIVFGLGIAIFFNIFFR